MIINNLDLVHYRNYDHLYLELDPKMNIIVGNNGIGKTNILESLVFISNTRSFRTTVDQELIQKDYEYARIIVNSNLQEYKAIINKEGKKLSINRNPIKKSSDFIGKINAILFKPDDLEVFSAAPRVRRRLLDIELGKIDKNYLFALTTYSKLLKDRNTLLKKDVVDMTYFDILSEQMIEPILTILKGRQEIIDFINLRISRYYQKLSNSHEHIELRYQKCCEINQDAVTEMIERSKEKDFQYHFTNSGPQKDDFQFYMDDSLVESYASQGQKRMIMIAFKFSMIDYIKFVTKTNPILLLDDILSELDINNKERLLNLIPDDIQTMITSTDIEGIKLKCHFRLFKLGKERVINE